MSTSHKEKIIRVLQLFQTTDEKTPMNAVQISQKLEEEYGMENVHRTSIYDDVRLLQSCGYPIKQAENSHKGWYMEKHLLEDWEIKLMLDSVQQARRLVKRGNVIVPSVEGSLESCAIITESYDNALCSTGFYVIDSEYYNSETLLVLLKSKPIQMLLKRGCSGTILTNITKEEFLDIPLPDVSVEIQKVIKEKVAIAYELRDKCKELLESAKSAVEKAIERDETSATSWLKDKMEMLIKEQL